jgi:glycosyltransferase involved in cell wall biosynthesis/ubiquinone/menaquinone biosynthesis C-methylase UbiE
VKFTGERYIPSEQGEIRLEHYHRYALVIDLVLGKDVLDLACGEGYGSSLMSEKARSVVGVDVSPEAIQHATNVYHHQNLMFQIDRADKLNLADASFDVVVSFETIEHLNEQEEMLTEIRRVLRPQGILIISSPNREIYADAAGHHNEFHVKELNFTEFDQLLKNKFPAIQYFGQRLTVGSTIQPLHKQSAAFNLFHDDGCAIQPNSSIIDGPVYFLAICAANQPALPTIDASLFYLSNYDLVKQYHQYAKWAQELNHELQHQQQINEQLLQEQQRIISWTKDLNIALAEKDQELQRIHEEHLRIVAWANNLNVAVVDRDNYLMQFRSSVSWRLTKPLRWLFSRIRRIKKIIIILPKAIAYYGSWSTALKKAFIILRRDGISGIKLKATLLHQTSNDGVISTTKYYEGPNLYGKNKFENANFMPKISIIVPNFNHEQYLRQRLESIYNQTYQNFEVILLDDHSTDGSTKILQEYYERFPTKTICCFNEINSGSVFHQWKKGLELATGDLIWIAESDDYCTSNLLAELIPYFENQAVMFSYCRSDFVKGEVPTRIWTTEEYLADLNLNCWQQPFIKSAHWLVNNAWAIKNIVPNASSALFRHPQKLDLLDDTQWMKLKLCGDWIFYLSIIRGGLVSYSPNATNYYRQHPNNTSVNTQKKDTYYLEHEIVAKKLVMLYQLNLGVLDRQKTHLYQHWLNFRGDKRESEFTALYNINRILRSAVPRKGNIVMAAYALITGGGETFPIILANLLKAHGYAVTFLNCNFQKTEPGIRTMLSKNIPLLELDKLELAGAVFNDLGIEMVHSHHASVDVTLASLLVNSPQIKQIVTMHGMYEMMEAKHLRNILPILEKRISRFVYTAEKQLPPFSESFRQRKGFMRIDNAIMLSEINPISRSELGIKEDDFVICLTARAIPEKGWEEGINALVWARSNSKKNIHLLLIGDGQEFDRLKSQMNYDFVHFLGFRPNVRDYYAIADLGFLPSRFKGESFPLVLMDCLHAGKPMLASNIGEINQMLQTDEGLAGELFELQNWVVPVQTVGKLIVDLVEDKERYEKLLRCVPKAAAKFDPMTMLKNYEHVYQSL